MRRREFITLFGGAVSWPIVVRAQTPKLRTIGFLGTDATNWAAWTAAFVARMREPGWIEGSTIAIEMTRVAVLRDPALSIGIGQFGVIQSAAAASGVEVSPVSVRDPGEIERAVADFARGSNGGLIVTASPLASAHRDLIVRLAAQHKLPAVLRTFFRHPRRSDFLRA